jgi:hypothetical protein
MSDDRNKANIEGVITRISEIEKVLTDTITLTNDERLKAQSRDKLNQLAKIKLDYLTYSNDIYNEAQAYDRAANNLIMYQYKAAGELQGVNDILSAEQTIAQKGITNKKRMVEINTYYSEKYADYIFIAKMIILLCAIIILLSILVRYSIISKGIYSFLIVVSCLVFILIIFSRWISMWYRDHVNYKKYNFTVPPYNRPTVSATRAGYISSNGVDMEAQITTPIPSLLSNPSNPGINDADGAQGYGPYTAFIMDVY